MKFTIKHFNELNGEEVLNIASARTKVFILEQNIQEEDLDILDLDAYHMYLNDNGIYAYCRILKPGKAYSEASIGRVLVTKEYRKKGIANEMMREAVDFIFNNLKEEKIKISAQGYIASLYESVGFEKEGEVYDEVGIPHIKMTLSCNKC